MTTPQLQAPSRRRAPARDRAKASAEAVAPAEYPVREYIAGMAHELAQMARWDGDEVLAGLLETATTRAGEPRP